MHSPTTRLLTVLEWLQAIGRLGGDDLAQRLQVGGYMLHRDVALLKELGMPVVAERERFGCYGLMQGLNCPLMFANTEARALSVGVLAANERGLARGGACGAERPRQTVTRDAHPTAQACTCARRDHRNGPARTSIDGRQRGHAGAQRGHPWQTTGSSSLPRSH